jgi:hypothetical protein
MNRRVDLEVDTLTIRIPIRLQRRGGRKLIMTPEGAAAPARKPSRDETLIKALVRAHRWRRKIESGQARSITVLAEQEGVTDAYVCRLLPLTCLAPDIVEAILDGRQPKGLRLAEILGNGPFSWEEQRRAKGCVQPVTRRRCLHVVPAQRILVQILRASWEVVELVERDPHLTREREQRRTQQAKGDDKQKTDDLFVPDPHKGADECQDDEHRCADAAADGKIDRVVHEPRAALEARNVGLEASPSGIVVSDGVQAADPIDDAVHPGDQDGDKASHGAEQKRWRCCVRNDLGELAEVRYALLHSSRVRQ